MIEREYVARTQRDTFVRAPLLIDVLKNHTNPLARLHALWTLESLYGLDRTVLADVTADSHPGLREHALRVAAVLESHRHEQVLPTGTLIKLADDPAVRVRLQAALALGERAKEQPAALDALAKIAVKDADDPWMRLAILSGLAESALAFIPLCDSVRSATGREQLQSQAAAIVGVRRRTPELASLLGMIATKRESNRAAELGSRIVIDCLTLLDGLAEGLERSGPGLHALISSAPPDLKPIFERLDRLWPTATALAVSKEPDGHRIVAIDVLARGRPALAESILPSLLSASQPVAIQTAAAQAVARAGRPSLASKALEGWRDLSLATRRDLLSALASSPALAETLITAIERDVIAPSELDAATREALGAWRMRRSGSAQRR